MDAKKRVYTIGMLCGMGGDSTEEERKKKAALCVYYDSWIKIKKDKKIKERILILYFLLIMN